MKFCNLSLLNIATGFPTPEEKLEADGRSVYVGNVSSSVCVCVCFCFCSLNPFTSIAAVWQFEVMPGGGGGGFFFFFSLF